MTEERKAYNKAYYLANKDEKLAYVKAWRKANPGKINSHRNTDEFRARYAEYCRNRRKDDPYYRLISSLRSRIKVAIRHGKKSSNTMDLVGCTILEVRQHLESLWQPGMSWDNYGLHGWHIDHIRPCSSFDLSDPEQQKICFHWTNLQPLWAADNLRKSDKAA